MAELKLVLNGKTVLEEIAPDMLLLDFVRSQMCIRDSDKIQLEPELEFIEKKMNRLKITLEQRTKDAIRTEQRLSLIHI